MRNSKKTVFVGAAMAVLALSGLAGAQDRTPDVRMASSLVADASAFETFMSKASAIQPGFPNGKAVADAVKVGASHDFRQLESGMIAYAALAALQEPAFIDGVERAAREDGREALVRRLLDQPEQALYLPAAEKAGARAAAALATRGKPLADDGRKVKQAAYDVQHQSWSKAKVADAAGRLARAKQLSAASFQPTGDDKARLYKAVASRPAAGFGDTPTPVLARALAVAALAVLDRAGEDNAQALQPLLTETRSASCLKMAKLNLFQCLAVAGPHYEDVFCLGQHAMIDPGQCVNEAAGVSGPVAAR
jgi:hypothetical protein